VGPQCDSRECGERRREEPEAGDQRAADEHVTQQAVELAEFVLVEDGRLVEEHRPRVSQAVANRSRLAGVVPGDQEVVEVDADADDDCEDDPAQTRQQVKPGVETGDQTDGDGDDEVVSRVDRESLVGRFTQAALMR